MENTVPYHEKEEYSIKVFGPKGDFYKFSKKKLDSVESRSNEEKIEIKQFKYHTTLTFYFPLDTIK